MVDVMIKVLPQLRVFALTEGFLLFFLRFCQMILIITLALSGCQSTEEFPEEKERDRTLDALNSLLKSPRQSPSNARNCLNSVPNTCFPPTRINPIPLRIALDPAYIKGHHNWKKRLNQTMQCVNRFFRDASIEWKIVDIQPWDPQNDQEKLYSLLSRLQREIPAQDAVRLGIIRWDQSTSLKRRSGEIGLAQGNSCIVPSWPQVRNDCLILAHELGHVLGAKHLPGKQWIMSPAAHPFRLPQNKDSLLQLTKEFRFHPANRTIIEAHASAKITATHILPTAACRKRIRRIRFCYGI